MAHSSSVHGLSEARILEIGCHFLLQGMLPDSGTELRLLLWQAGSLLVTGHWGDQLLYTTISTLPCLACFGLNFLFFHHYLQELEGE